LILTLIKGQHF